MHLAIIMDGNGRWARSRGLVRTDGHKRGADAVERVAKFCAQNGVQNLSLYAFSTENWRRPKSEIEFLFRLLSRFIKERAELFLSENIRFLAIGDLSVLDEELRANIKDLERKTAHASRLNLALAINYGGKDEIVRATKKLIASSVATLADELSESSIFAHLDAPFMGEVDMLIRTGGEMRLSNFMLWQASYAELFFTPTFWPDFSTDELAKMLAEFRSRQRNFGGIL